MENVILKVKDLSLTYYGGYDAVGDVSFELLHGDKLCVFGGQNQGKTSLMRALAGLEVHQRVFRLFERFFRPRSRIVRILEVLRLLKDFRRTVGEGFHRLPVLPGRKAQIDRVTAGLEGVGFLAPDRNFPESAFLRHGMRERARPLEDDRQVAVKRREALSTGERDSIEGHGH